MPDKRLEELLSKDLTCTAKLSSPLGSISLGNKPAVHYCRYSSCFSHMKSKRNRLFLGVLLLLLLSILLGDFALEDKTEDQNNELITKSDRTVSIVHL